MIDYKKNKKFLQDNNAYDPKMEHDACGVGMIASTNGKKSRKKNWRYNRKISSY